MTSVPIIYCLWCMPWTLVGFTLAKSCIVIVLYKFRGHALCIYLVGNLVCQLRFLIECMVTKLKFYCSNFLIETTSGRFTGP